jgi:hypothetical protein
MVTQVEIDKQATVETNKACIALSPILNPAKNEQRTSDYDVIKTKPAPSRESRSRVSIVEMESEIMPTDYSPQKECFENSEQQRLLTPQISNMSINTQIELRYEEVQEKLREVTENEHAIEFQYFQYQMIRQKKFSKFRNSFLEKLPTQTDVGSLEMKQQHSMQNTSKKEEFIEPMSQKSLSNSPLRRNIKLAPSQVKLDSLATNLPAFSIG